MSYSLAYTTFQKHWATYKCSVVHQFFLSSLLRLSPPLTCFFHTGYLVLPGLRNLKLMEHVGHDLREFFCHPQNCPSGHHSCHCALVRLRNQSSVLHQHVLCPHMILKDSRLHRQKRVCVVKVSEGFPLDDLLVGIEPDT